MTMKKAVTQRNEVEVLDNIRTRRHGWLAKTIVYFIAGTMMLPVVPASYASGIVSDPNAEIRFQPQINYQNATPVVNIVAPNNTGLSHNQYEQFNIDVNGAVLNNSLVSGTSQLAAEIIANPNLNGVAASTILNEVTSSSTSEMMGALEVFGQSANVIVANRNGITCNDCGFINTDRVTLTTGVPQYIGHALFFDIDNGTISFVGEGVDHKLSPKILDIFSRYIDVDGEVQSDNELNLISGALSLNYTKLLNGELSIDKKEVTSFDDRAYAIDASIFGAMQSGKISVMATEEGLGVRSDSYLFSQSDSLFIDSSGDIDLRDADSFEGMQISSHGDINVSEDLIANTTINTDSENFRNVKDSEVTADIVNLHAVNNLVLDGEINSRQTNIHGKYVDIQADLISLEDINISANELGLNDNEVVGDKLSVDVHSADISDALISAKNIDLISSASLNIGESTVAAEAMVMKGNNTAVSQSVLQSNVLNISSPDLSVSETEMVASDISIASESVLLSDVFTHTDDLSIDGESISFTSSDFIVKDLRVDSDEIISRDNQYQSEEVKLISDTALLVGDKWQILLFEPESENSSSGEVFDAQVNDFDLIDSMFIARTIELQGDEVALRSSDVQSDWLSITATEAVLDANSRVRVTNDILVDGQEVTFQADTDARNIDIDGKSVVVGGKVAVSEALDIESDQLMLNQSEINADVINLESKALTADLTTVVSRIFKASVDDLFTTEGLGLHSEYITLAAREVALGSDTELSSRLLSVQAQSMSNQGDVRTSERTDLDLDQLLDNSGKLISYKNLYVQADTIDNRDGATLSSSQASLVANNINNAGRIGADYLFLDYNKISNTAGAQLSADTMSLLARSEQSLLHNAGSISIGQLMDWENEELSAGSFINGGVLDAHDLDLTGLNKFYISDPNNTKLVGRATISNQITGDLEYFYQGGSLNASNLEVQVANFDNSGITEVTKASVAATGGIVNSGDLNAESLIFRASMLANKEGASLTGSDLSITADEVTNAGTVGGYVVELSSNSNTSKLTNSGSIIQRNEYAGQQKVDGVLSIGGFSLVSNEGDVETDERISLHDVDVVENGQKNVDASIVALGDIDAARIGILDNAGLIVGQQFNIDADNLRNTGKLSLERGDFSINDTLENNGILYQREEANEDDQVYLAASTFINGEDAATDIIRGVLDLSSGSPGTLINKGLLAERKDAANSGLAMRGIGSLQNSGQISMSSEFAMSGGDFHNEGADAYIGVGVLRLEALQSLANDGSLVYDADSTIAANQLTNQGVIASTDENPSASLAVDAQQLANAGRISTSGELALNQTVSGRVSNAGLLYGDQVTLGSVDQRQLSVVNSGVNSLDAQGELVAGGIQSKNGPVEIVTQSFANHDQNTQGQVTSGNELKLDVSSAVNLRGKVEAAGAVALNMAALDVNQNASVRSASGNSHITVAGDANIAGDIQLSGNSQLNAGRLDNSGQIQGNQLGFAIGGQLNNRGKIVTGSVAVGAGSISNSGQLHGNQQVTLTSTQLNNAGQLTSANRMSLNAHGGSLSNSGTVNAIQLNASANRISTGAGSFINAQDASLQASQIENRGTLNQAQGSGQFILSADAIANLGSSALMDISRGSLQASELSNEGTIVSERGSDAGQLIIHPLESLDNSGQLFAHSDLQISESLTNSGKLQVKDITADGITSFSNSGDLRAENAAYIASSSDLINEGNVIANEVTLNSQRLVTNSGLVRADSNMVIEANKITNAEGAEISTSNDSAGMTITARQSAVNQGNIIAKGDIDLDVAHFDNRGNMTATQTGTLKLDSLNNNGYIYGKDIVVGSQTQYITEDGLAGSQSTSGNVTGLYADNSLTMFVQGLLKATYQSKLITLNSDQDLEIGGNVYADDILNIDVKGLTVLDTGIISINGNNSSSVWEIDGDVLNQGYIATQGDLKLTATNLTNESELASVGLIDITAESLANTSDAVLSGKAGLSIQGTSGVSQTLFNEGALVSGDVLDLDVVDIENSGKISSRGGSWNFSSLSNSEEGKIYSLGDTFWGTDSSRVGALDNEGVIVTSNVDAYVESFKNEDGSQFVSIGDHSYIDSSSFFYNGEGSILSAKNDLRITTANQLQNFGGIKSYGDATLSATTIMNGSLDERALGLIDIAGALTVNASLMRNEGWTVDSGKQDLVYKIGSYGFRYKVKEIKKLGVKVDEDYYLYHTVGVDYGYSEKQAERSEIYSGGKAQFNARVENEYSYIGSGDTVVITGGGYNSSDTIDVTQTVVQFKSPRQEKPKEDAKEFFTNLQQEFSSGDEELRDKAYNILDNNHVSVGSDGSITFRNYKYPSGPISPHRVLSTTTSTMDNPYVVGIIYGRNGTSLSGDFVNNGYANTRKLTIGDEEGANGADEAADAEAAQLAQQQEQSNQDVADIGSDGAGYSGSDTASGTREVDVANVDPALVPEEVPQSSFTNKVSGPSLLDLQKEPASALLLLESGVKGYDYEDLNALAVGGDKSPHELAAEKALRDALAQLGSRTGENSEEISAGQVTPFGDTTATLYDLPEDIRNIVFASYGISPDPRSALELIPQIQRPDVDAQYFYNPIEEAQLLRTAAMRESGSTYFSDDWRSAQQQRDAMFNNSLAYLENNESVKLGEALTQEQIASLESPLLWYISKNIGGEEKLVPAVYLPEATMAQMTTPEAGKLNVDTLIANVDEFTNSGLIDVKEHASIEANTFTNQRLTNTVETDHYARTSVSDGGAINAGSLTVKTTGDINNLGGSMKTDGDLTLDADGNVNLAAVETREYFEAGKNIDEKNGYVTSTIEAGGNAELIAGGDINSQAADVTVEGDLGLDAENINLLGVTEREYQQRHSEKSDTFSSSEKTEQWETQTFKGTTFDVGGNTSMTARNDINMVGTTIEGDGNIGLKAGNDVLITAGISQESYSKEKSGEGAFTTSGQQKGHITQTAVGSNLHAGGNLTIDSDGGDVSILGSTLRAEENLLLGDMKIQRDETGAPILDENGQYITEDGESIANLTIGSVELKDEEWNEKQSGLKGPLKKLAQVAAFTLSATGVSQQMQALGIDTEITIARSESERTETTRHVGSTTTAGGNLVARLDEHLQVNGSEVGADGSGLLHSKTASYDTTTDTTTTTKQRSEETVSADEMALSKDEVIVASATHTDHTETETTVEQTANVTKLNFGNFSSNTVGDTAFNGVDATILGDASITGGDVSFGTASTTDSKVSEEHTVETSYSVGVRNAYVDAAYAAEAVADATSAVGDAKDALDDAKRRVKDGTLAQSALDDFHANLAAAQAQLTNATIALGAAGATAAGSSGTGGFYASAGVNRNETSKQSSESHTTQHGSEFKVGGSAFISARDGGAIDIIGSSLDVGEHLSLDADDVNILASANESRSSSSEQSRSAGFSVSTSGADGASAAQQMAAASGSANVNEQNSDSDSYSKTYNNSSIKAGSLSSTSENLHLAGANVDITGDIDITTDTLIVESLQNESRSSNSSEGGGFSASSGGGGTVSYNNTDGSSERAWTDEQTTLIGGGNVNINAKNTEVHGAVVANAVRNEDGSLTDLGNLNLITDELIVTDLKDTDVSESSGINMSVSMSSGKDEKGERQLSANSTTVGLTNQGHRKEQTTSGTLGGGTITRRDGSEHDLGDTNRDLNNTQVVTLDQQTGGLNATVTVDHRLMSEEGRKDIKENFEDTYEHGEDIGRAAQTVATDERSSLLDFGTNVHNNSQLTQLKNELVRNPAYQSVVAGLNSKDPEQYQQAMQVVGQLAQDKFGLNPTDIQFYDGGETTSSSLADVDGLTDRKGGTVADASNAENGNIFIDGGDGASKTDMANTLGHEVLESQMQQGQGSGLFGTPSGDAKESLADALGAQMQDRLNQAAGGNLDSTGGADFSAALASSAGVRAGTERANNVGGATVENRQLYTEEGEWLQGQVANYAVEKGISEEQAQRDLTQAALRSADSTHNHQLRETDDNIEALEWLSDQADSNPEMPSELATLVRLEEDIEGNTSHAEKTEIRRESGYYNREKNAVTWQDPSLAPMYESAIDADLSGGPTSVMRDKRTEEICGPDGCMSMNPTLAGAIAGVANETVLMGAIDPEKIQDPDVKEAFETASDITTAVSMATLAGAGKNAVEMMVKKSDDIVDAVDSNKIREVTEKFGDKGPDTKPAKNADGYNVPETVTRRDNDFSSPVNEKGVGKSRIDEDGNLIPANPDADVDITRHVANDRNYKNDAPTTSTSEVGGESQPKNYGSDQIEIDTGRLQRDINDGKVTGTKVIPSQQIKDHLQDKVNAAQRRYDANPSKNNAGALERAKRNLENASRDNECLLVGCVPKNYIKGGK